MTTCKRGKTIGWKGPDVVWNGGWSTCVCCQQGYGWIEHSHGDSDGTVAETVADKEFCSGCGGRDTKYLRADMENHAHPERERWFFTVRKLTIDEWLALVRAAVVAGLELGTLRKLVERIPPDAPQRREAVLLVKDAR